MHQKHAVPHCKLWDPKNSEHSGKVGCYLCRRQYCLQEWHLKVDQYANMWTTVRPEARKERIKLYDPFKDGPAEANPQPPPGLEIEIDSSQGSSSSCNQNPSLSELMVQINHLKEQIKELNKVVTNQTFVLLRLNAALRGKLIQEGSDIDRAIATEPMIEQAMQDLGDWDMTATPPTTTPTAMSAEKRV